jgi:hypothetical protein
MDQVKISGSEKYYVIWTTIVWIRNTVQKRYCIVWLNVQLLKGIVSRDFVVCFLVSFDRSNIYTHQERVLLLLKVRFRIKFFDFRVWPWWAPEGKWRLNLSKYGAHTQDILLLFMLIITDDPVKKNGAKFWTCKKSCG